MKLELKIPPLAVFLIAVFCMWMISKFSINTPMSLIIRTGGTCFFLFLGILGLILSMISYMNNETTLNPTSPEKTQSLITDDLFKFTRNPIYLSMVFLLISLVFFFENYISVLVVPIFIFYMTKFQIVPEERMLEKQFGTKYSDFKSKVRRWV